MPGGGVKMSSGQGIRAGREATSESMCNTMKWADVWGVWLFGRGEPLIRPRGLSVTTRRAAMQDRAGRRHTTRTNSIGSAMPPRRRRFPSEARMDRWNPG